MKHSWEQIRNQVRQFRNNLQSLYPIQVLATVKDFVIHNNTLYFLSNTCYPTIDLCPTRNLFLYEINLDQIDQLTIDESTLNSIFSNKNNNTKEYLKLVNKLPLLDRSLIFKEYTSLFKKENDDTSYFYQLLQIQGMTQFEIKEDVILFTFRDDIFVAKIGKVMK
ncbi:uncharacterized protein BX663DRAFT_222052 [Cokeromyces recurvatus]|uniref:uncharacterized protein n=1 Tax=Cokeromyces recurvatus TaxID=90255 RepID=UPI002220BCC0|nr:uncharacterized protein BX663DRAFT_222052 [Cokeromyces recurvatus]KAI7899154.1 hypothetical protein BX663DRAFT_222052 [Cokeromyces recurvatus]